MRRPGLGEGYIGSFMFRGNPLIIKKLPHSRHRSTLLKTSALSSQHPLYSCIKFLIFSSFSHVPPITRFEQLNNLYKIQHIQQSRMLKIFIIIPLQLILIGATVYYFSAAPDQLSTHSAIPICLETQTVHRLCAQCFRRDKEDILRNKGYHVLAEGSASVLKIQSEADVLSCAQMLQLIDFNKDHVTGAQFHLEAIQSISQLIPSLKAKLSFKKSTIYTQSEYVVEPWYQQFAVFKWKQYSKEGEVNVTSVDSEYYTAVNQSLFYMLNFVVLAVFVAWMADGHFISQEPLSLKIALLCLVVCAQLSLLDIWRGGFHWLARLFFLNLGLIKLRISNFQIMAYMSFGLLMTYFPFTLCIYNGCMTILVAYYGRDQSQTRSAKLYLVIFYTLLMLNYSYWYRYVLYLNDIPSLVIEFLSFMMVPVGLFLLPNQREHEKIHDKDPQIRSISLSGFDEDDDGR